MSVTPWTAAHQVFLPITNSQSLLKLMPIESVISSNHLIFCHHLLLRPSIFPSIRDFSNKSVLCIRWPKYWSFSFSISPFNEYSGLISFRMDWLDLLTVQGTLKSLQHHSSKAAILQWANSSAFLMVQFPHSYDFISDLRGNVFSFSTLNMMLAVGLSYMTFIMLRCVPSMPAFWRVFIINKC